MRNFIKNLKFSSVIDFLFFNLTLFLIFFAWTRFIFKNVLIALIITFALIIAINIIKNIRMHIKSSKNTTLKIKSSEMENCLLLLIAQSNQEKIDLFSSFYEKNDIELVLDNIIVFKDNSGLAINFSHKNESQENNETNATENTEINNGIGGAVEEPTEETEEVAENQNLSQEEQDILNVKNTTSFIKPIEGTISSVYGYRETATGTVPKDHTGTDIAAITGTKIKSATDGQVVLASEEGDYGKHIKVQIGEVSIIYAHCNSLYVKEGDMVTQGQEIAEVGSTGNSTGPHLHFEIRISERTVDPQKILEL